MPIWIFNNEYDKVRIQELCIANIKGNQSRKELLYRLSCTGKFKRKQYLCIAP